MKRLYEGLLLECAGIGQSRLKLLKEAFGDAESAWIAESRELVHTGLFQGQQSLQAFLQSRSKIKPLIRQKEWEEKGIHLCGFEDPEYPPLLKMLYDPPELLFFRGRIQTSPFLLAIVGSRKSTPYGRNVARSFAETLARRGVTVVSGAARGIDTAAHEGALVADGITVAVLGCGVDVVYPPENRRLLEQIVAKGCVLSEYPPGTPPAAGRFPARNRIVAGLGQAVLVVEAAEKSGALITADQALNENRDVYAIPGSIFSELSRGTNRLIQQGARMVCAADEILTDFGMVFSPETANTPDLFSAQQKEILAVLSPEQPLTLDELIDTLKIDPAEIQYCLLELELGGHVEKDLAMRYVIKVSQGVKSWQKI